MSATTPSDVAASRPSCGTADPTGDTPPLLSGFTCIATAADFELRLHGTGPAEHPLLGLHRHTNGDAAVFMGQLHNPTIRGDAAADAATVLAAYQRSGLAALERLEGDFALALWDASARQLIGCRDPLGGYPLFWAETEGGGLALGTSFSPLLDRLPRRALNPDYIAEFLSLGGLAVQGREDACAYLGLHRVRPGAWVEGTPGEAMRQHRYWELGATLEDPGTDQLETIAEGYGARLREAVRRRIRGRTLAHMSGGMDSTAVALLARDLLAAGTAPWGESPLHTLSLIYPSLPVLAREGAWVELAAEAAAGAIVHRLPADGLLHFDSLFEATPSHDEPVADLPTLAPHQAMLRLAAGLGVRTILTGAGADDLVDMQPHHLTDMLRRFQLRAAWAEAAAWAEEYCGSRWSILYPFGLAQLIPGWTERGLGALLPIPGRHAMHRQGDATIAPWIRPEFARRHGLAARAVASARRSYQAGPGGVAVSLAIEGVESRTAQTTRWLLAAPLGIAISNPFLDPQLLRYGLGALARLRPVPGAGPKPVLATAMREVLPAAIRTRRRKRGFNEAYYRGLARNLPRIEVLVRAPSPADALDFLDRDALIGAVRAAAFGGAHPRELTALNRTLALLRWLAMQT